MDDIGYKILMLDYLKLNCLFKIIYNILNDIWLFNGLVQLKN
jgi:hypothetical protein